MEKHIRINVDNRDVAPQLKRSSLPELDVDIGQSHPKLNIENEPSIPVFPPQMALANNILKRLQFSQELQGRKLSQFKCVEMQVSSIYVVILLSSCYIWKNLFLYSVLCIKIPIFKSSSTQPIDLFWKVKPQTELWLHQAFYQMRCMLNWKQQTKVRNIQGELFLFCKEWKYIRVSNFLNNCFFQRVSITTSNGELKNIVWQEKMMKDWSNCWKMPKIIQTSYL